MISTTFVLAAAALLALANGHGFLKDPVARTAIHTRPDLGPTEPPYSWNYQGHWCDNVPQDQQYSTCGRCGDEQGGTDSNQGGMWDKGVIAATYESGSLIDIVTEYGANHNGYFFVELCPQEFETDGCFQRLPVLSATEEVRDGNRVCTGQATVITAKVWLPAGVRCERCTIRWTYRTSYGGWPDWNACENPHDAQTFRNCADVKIV